MSDDIRTFGELRFHRPWLREKYSYTSRLGLTYQCCSSCKRGQPEVKALWKYSVRAYLCDDCMEHRKDEVMPEVRKREKFNAKLAALRTST